MTPLVSILIPAYNAAPWIIEAIQSGINQTWSRTEIIVVDDGSKDETLVIAQRFSSAQVQVLSHENQGASATRNRALQEAQGDYIQWLDADDVLDPDKIELQLHGPQPETVLLSSAWARFYYRRNKAIFRKNDLCQDHDPVSWLQTKMETNSWMAIETWLVSRYLTERAGQWNTSLSADDDGEYFARVVAASSDITYEPAAKSRCRLANHSSLSKGIGSRRWLESQLRSLRMQISILRGLDDSERTRLAAISVLQRWYAHYYPDHKSLMDEATAAAVELGGTLEAPKLRGKYRWLEPIVGQGNARALQAELPALRSRFDCSWDKFMYSIGL